MLSLQRLRRTLLLLSPAALALLAACTPDNPQSTFGTGGPVAEQQADLFIFIFWVSVVVFIIVEGLIIYSVLRFRRRRDDEMPRQTHGNMKLEITWTIIPAVILAVIAVPTITGIWETYKPSEARGEAMEVEAVGHQWWFEFRYPDREIVTANELHVPTGQPILVHLHSQDVIHSFWVPKLAGKVDMVPVNENLVWFQADEPGVYLGQCAEFCGIQHAKMRFRVIAQPPEEFEAWAAGMNTPPAPLAAGSPASTGQGLFAANCAMCHSVDSYRDGAYAAEIAAQTSRWDAWLADRDGSQIVSAPNLTYLGQRLTLGAGITDLNRENLIEWITDPSTIKVGTRMEEHAGYLNVQERGLTPDQVGAIADYLLSLEPGEAAAEPTPPAGGGDPIASGESLFQANGCSGCHSTGTDTRVGPGLAGVYERADERVPGLSAEAYITQSLRQPTEFVVEGFPPAMPSFGSLTDAQIQDLIAYLQSLE